MRERGFEGGRKVGGGGSSVLEGGVLRGRGGS